MVIHSHTAHMNTEEKPMNYHEYEYEDPWISMNMNMDTMNFHDYEHDYEMNFKVHEFIWTWIWCSWTVWLWISSWIWNIWLWITMSSMNKICKVYEFIWVWIWNSWLWIIWLWMTMNSMNQILSDAWLFMNMVDSVLFCSRSQISSDSHSCSFPSFF